MENNLLQQNPNEVPIQAELIEQFKSLFYLFKGKRDTQIRLYDDNKTFYRSNILDINQTIQDKLLLHNVTNKIVNISLALSGNKVKTFGNWLEFENEKWDTNDEVDSIVINWDFEIVLPNRVHTIPQTHSLKIRIGREIKPTELIHLMMIGSDEYELEENSSQMVCKVDFVNSIIAIELLDRVDQWYKSLSTKISDNATNIWLNKWSNKLRLFSEILIVISGFFFLYPVLSKFIFNPDNVVNSNKLLQSIFIILSLTFICFAVFNRLASYVSFRLDRAIDKLQGTPIFEITNGDKNLLDKILKKNKTLRREIYLKLIVSLISSGILYVAGQLIKIAIEKLQ